MIWWKFEYGKNDPDLNVVIDFEDGPPYCTVYDVEYFGKVEGNELYFYVTRGTQNYASGMTILETIITCIFGTMSAGGIADLKKVGQKD